MGSKTATDHQMIWMKQEVQDYAINKIGISNQQWSELCRLLSTHCMSDEVYQTHIDQLITNLKSLEKNLQNNQELLATVLDNIGACIYMKSLDGRYLYANPAFSEFVGKQPMELIGLKDSDLFTPLAAKQLFNNDLTVISEQRKFATLETMTLVNSSTTSYSWSVKVPLNDISGKTYAILGISTDITERKNLEDHLLYLATTDELTQLYNRRHFLNLSEQTLNRSKRYDEPLTLLICDIDFFKHINDTFGHHVGDLVLNKVAKTLKSILRETDIAGRIGGEEFAILLVQTNQTIGLDVAERLRLSIENNPIYIDDGKNNNIPITVSIGAASPVYPYETLSSLMLRADQSLYQAKRSGRNQVCLAA